MAHVLDVRDLLGYNLVDKLLKTGVGTDGHEVIRCLN